VSARPLTASQTVGPFFHDCLMREDAQCDLLASFTTDGVRIRVEGRVIDGDGAPVPDAILELWQANAHGRYRHDLDRGPAPIDPHFVGFGRCPTDARGAFHFDTVKPGAIHAGDGRRHAPHLNVTVFARGMLVHAFTRVYFEEDELDADPVLAQVDRDRRATLVARKSRSEAGRVVYRWDIRLQGDQETVFFDA